MPYARVITLGLNNRRPDIAYLVHEAETGNLLSLVGLVSAKFFMRNLDTGALKLDGVAATIDIPNSILRHLWIAGELDTAALYIAWFVMFWGAGDTLPQDTDAFELSVIQPWQRMVA